MTVEAAILFPLILVLIVVMMFSYLHVCVRAFHDYEEGVPFLLSISGKPCSLNGYDGVLPLVSEDHLMGKMLKYQGKTMEFHYYKASRILYGAILGD